MELTAKSLKPWREAWLAAHPHCSLCGLPLSKEEAVTDHDHARVENNVRGVIHRSCNSVLGKLESGKRYGKNFNVLAFAKGVHAYLVKDPLALTYPERKTKQKRKPKPLKLGAFDKKVPK